MRFARSLTVAVVLVALVALEPVYLRAHYLTDVLGGVALGAAIFALVGIVALVVGPCATMTSRVSNDDQITYVVAGAAAWSRSSPGSADRGPRVDVVLAAVGAIAGGRVTSTCSPRSSGLGAGVGAVWSSTSTTGL